MCVLTLSWLLVAFTLTHRLLTGVLLVFLIFRLVLRVHGIRLLTLLTCGSLKSQRRVQSKKICVSGWIETCIHLQPMLE